MFIVVPLKVSLADRLLFRGRHRVVFALGVVIFFTVTQRMPMEQDVILVDVLLERVVVRQQLNLVSLRRRVNPVSLSILQGDLIQVLILDGLRLQISLVVAGIQIAESLFLSCQPLSLAELRLGQLEVGLLSKDFFDAEGCLLFELSLDFGGLFLWHLWENCFGWFGFDVVAQLGLLQASFGRTEALLEGGLGVILGAVDVSGVPDGLVTEGLLVVFENGFGLF
jgi:hypothetical protein